MDYYHVYIKYKREFAETIGEENNIEFNHSEEMANSRITEPYNQAQSFQFAGRIIQPSQVEVIHVFYSKIPYDEIILPNGKITLQCRNAYCVKLFLTKKVKTVETHTPWFIKPVFTNSLNVTSKLTTAKASNQKIFIVHGRDDREALSLQKYLKDSYFLDVVIFDDFKKQTTGKTVIEALEEIRDSIGYAFIIAAPEDLGQWREEVNDWCKENLMCYSSVEAQKVNQLIKDTFNTRARQNVVFEYGLFMGALGRDRVCCLLKNGTNERPSDVSGVLYEEFNHTISEKFADIVEKLKNPKIGLIK